MRLSKRLNTVFYKLIVSYTILVLVTTSTVGATFYFYYTVHYNTEVTKVASQLLQYQRKIADENVFDKAEKLYTNLVTGRYSSSSLTALFEESYEGNHSKISEAQQFLTSLVQANSDAVQSIQIFFRGSRMELSSTSGVHFLEADDEVPDEAAWKPAEAAGLSMIWTRSVAPPLLSLQDAAAGTEETVFIGSYPYNLPGNANKGLIAIRIRPAALSDILQDSSRTTPGVAALIDSKGKLVATSGDAFAPDPDAVQRIVTASGPAGNFMYASGGVKTIVSYETLESNGWKLINITPVDTFYRAVLHMQRMLLLFTIGAILLGFIVAYLFSFRIYNPLRAIVDKARRRIGEGPAGGKGGNEFAMLDGVIDNLSVKVNELESTLSASRPLLKYHLASSLLQGTLGSQDEWRERLKLVELDLEGHSFACAILELDSIVFRSLSLENRQFITYNLIRELEKRSDSQTNWLAIEFPGARIGIAAAFRERNDRKFAGQLNSLLGYITNNFMVHAVASVGSWTESPFELQRSRAEAETLLGYRYFSPGIELFTDLSLLRRETSGATLPEEWLERFDKALRIGDADSVQAIIEQFVHEAKHGAASAEHCRGWMRRMIEAFHRFGKEMHLPSLDRMGEQSRFTIFELESIDAFAEWLIVNVRYSLQLVEERGRNRHSELVERVKQYVSNHLDKDLSLNLLADYVQLSPRYLGKIFKEETDIGFVDYVTEERMKKARDLIVAGSQTVEQIAGEVGFHSPAYFIKKFKETFGMTPKAFRHSNFMKQHS